MLWQNYKENLMKKVLILLLLASLSSAVAFANDKEREGFLNVGETVPSSIVKNLNSDNLDLKELTKNKLSLVIFYRGGWCPYCNLHLAEISKIENLLLKLGYEIYALSADSPNKIKEAKEKHKYSYTLLSDSEMEAAKAFGLAFKVDDETVKLYKNKYQIDLEASSGKTHHMLPVPAAYLIDKGNVVRFVYYNPDYKVRVKSSELLDKAKEIATKSK